MEESIVRKFYKDVNVFITGGTGFLGKLLVEKLLRSTQVATIYLMIREKKGKSVKIRLNELLDDIVFEKLKSEDGNFRHRIEAVSGDCVQPGLGLNIVDRQKLIENVNIVFHVAATVRFDEHIKLAYNTNVNAIKHVIELAKELHNLKSIVHISTAYSNCHLNVIEEKFYEYPADYKKIGDLLNSLNDQQALEGTTDIIGNWPNTYTFTKALAESYVAENCDGLPIGVLRPAIVISTYKEPIEAWIDNFNGPSGITAGSISGLIRVVPCDQHAIADLVPADTCVAAIIAAGWDIANRNPERRREHVPIYNYVSSPENPITWGMFLLINRKLCDDFPVMTSIYWPMIITTTNAYAYELLKFFAQFVPAVAVDAVCTVLGRKARLIETLRRAHKLVDVVSFFGTNSWTFTNRNTVRLWEKLNHTDKELFPLSMKNVHWLQYMYNYIRGIRRYLLKDPDSTLREAKEKHLKLKKTHIFLEVLCFFALSVVIYIVFGRIFSCIFK